MTRNDEQKPDRMPHRGRLDWRWSALLAMLFTGQLLVVCNILIVPPILPFVTRDLALTAWQTTALLTSFPAIALATNFCIGPIVDRTGILHIFRLGLLLVTLCFLGSAVAPNGTALIFMRVLSGMAFPMIGMTAYALAAANSPGAPGRRMIAMISGTASFGPLVMLPFGMFFADTLSWRFVFLVLAVSALATLAASWLIRGLEGGTRLARSDTRTRVTLVANPEIRAILFTYFLQSLGFFTIIAVFPSIIASAYDDTTRRIAIFIFGGISGLVGAFLVGRIFPNRSPLTLAGWAVTANILIALVFPGVIASYAVISLVWAAFSLLRQAVVALLLGHGNSVSPPAQRATFNSLLNVAFQLGSLTGGFIAAQLYFVDPSFWTLALTSAAAFAVSAMALGRRLLAATAASNSRSRNGDTQ